MELGPEHVAAFERDRHLPSVLAGPHHRSRAVRTLWDRHVGVHEVVPASLARPEQARAAPRNRTHKVPLHLRTALAPVEGAYVARQDPQSGDLGVLLRSLEEELKTDTDPEEGAAVAYAEP